MATIQQDLVSVLGDEAKITTMEIQGISSSTSSSISPHSFKLETMHDESKRSKLFHIKFISNNTKVDTLLDSVSLANMISK